MMKKEDLMYVSNVTEKVSDAEYENMHLLYDTLDAAARVSNSTMFVIDFSQNKLVYRTEKLFVCGRCLYKRCAARKCQSVLVAHDYGRYECHVGNKKGIPQLDRRLHRRTEVETFFYHGLQYSIEQQKIRHHPKVYSPKITP